jgi:hypothetical protein
MTKRNHHTNTVPDTCLNCGKVKGYLVAKTPKFKASKKHSTGPCPECEKQLNDMVDMMTAGGTLVVCTQCHSINVQMEIPPSLQPMVTQLPLGGKRLEIAGCPLCAKEATDVSNDPGDQAPSPTVGV